MGFQGEWWIHSSIICKMKKELYKYMKNSFSKISLEALIQHTSLPSWLWVANMQRCKYIEKRTKYVWFVHCSYDSCKRKFYLLIKQNQKLNKTSGLKKLYLDILNDWHQEWLVLEKQRWLCLSEDFIHLGRDAKVILFYITQRDFS